MFLSKQQNLLNFETPIPFLDTSGKKPLWRTLKMSLYHSISRNDQVFITLSFPDLENQDTKAYKLSMNPEFRSIVKNILYEILLKHLYLEIDYITSEAISRGLMNSPHHDLPILNFRVKSPRPISFSSHKIFLIKSAYNKILITQSESSKNDL